MGDSSFISLTWLLGFYVGSCLAWFVYTEKPTAELNRNYGLTFSILSVYLLLVWALHVLPSDAPLENVLFWSRILVVGTLFSPPALYRFMRILSEHRGLLSRSFETFGWLLAAFLMTLNIFGLYLDIDDFEYRTDQQSWFPRMQGYYQVFTAYTLIWLAVGLVQIVVAIRKVASHRRRLQLLYFLGGLFVTLAAFCLNFLGSISLAFNIPPYPGGLAYTLYTALIGYTIVRYQLFDITLIVRRSLIYGFSSLCLGGTYGLVLVLAGNLGPLWSKTTTIVFSVGFIIISGLAFHPLLRFIQHGVDRLFFRQQADYEAALRRFADQIAHLTGLEKTASALVESLDETLHPTCTVVAVRDVQEQLSVVSDKRHGGEVQTYRWLQGEELLSESLAERISDGAVRIPWDDQVIPQQYRTDPTSELGKLVIRSSGMAVPIQKEDQISGLILLGPKRADEDYSTEDIKFVKGMADQSTVALAHALAYARLIWLEQFSNRILMSLDVAVISVEPSGKVHNANPSALKLFKQKELKRNILLEEMIGTIPELKSIFIEGLKKDKDIDAQPVQAHCNGDNRSFLLSTRRVPAEHLAGNVAILMLSDVTEFRNLQGEIARQEHLATLGRLTSSINHQVGNIITPIRRHVELLLDRKDKMDDSKPASVIQECLDSLDHLVSALRDFGRPLELNFRPTSISVLMNSALHELAAEVEEHNIQISMELSPDLPKLYIDALWMRQVLINILHNAIHAMKEVKKRIVTIEAKREGESICLCITDTGTGISSDKLDKIFEPFYTTKGRSGTGLGLPIAKRIIEAHRGNIVVENEAEGGTVFRLCLPMQSVETASLELGEITQP